MNKRSSIKIILSLVLSAVCTPSINASDSKVGMKAQLKASECFAYCKKEEADGKIIKVGDFKYYSRSDLSTILKNAEIVFFGKEWFCRKEYIANKQCMKSTSTASWAWSLGKSLVGICVKGVSQSCKMACNYDLHRYCTSKRIAAYHEETPEEFDANMKAAMGSS